MANPVSSNPEVMGGTPCFAGTRVPIKNLFDYLEDACSLDEFLEQFPTVSKESAVAVLEEAQRCLLKDAAAA